MSKTKTTTFTVSVDGREARVRIPNDLTNDFGVPVSAGEAERIAVDRGVKKLFGKMAFWRPDRDYYYRGQVMRHEPGIGSSAITLASVLSVWSDTDYPVNERSRQAAIRAYEGFWKKFE